VGGGIFDKSWFRYWHTKAGVPVPQDNEFPCRDEFCVVLPEGGLQIESWDMTFKSTAKSDFVAGGVWLWDPPNAYLIHQVCDRMTFIQTCKALTEVSRRYPRAFTKLVEEKANGAAVIDILKKHISGLIPINPKASKSSRMHAVSGLFEAGNVFIPHPDLAPWVPSYRVQVSQAPKGTNDDMVDQTTQALLRLARKGGKFVDAMRVVRKELES
jgi:predicted phage terminase large subunit-like protein